MNLATMASHHLARCSYCKTTSLLDNFRYVKGVRKNTCKPCGRKQSSESQVRRADKRRIYMKAYLQKRREDPEWRAKRKVQQDEWVFNNPDNRNATKRRYYEAHPDRRLLRGIQSRVSKKNGRRAVYVTITKEWIKERLDKGVCEVTGIPFDMTSSKRMGRCAPYSPTVDRKDSSKDYTSDNCRLIIWALNMGLSEWGDEVYAHVANEFLKARGRG